MFIGLHTLSVQKYSNFATIKGFSFYGRKKIRYCRKFVNKIGWKNSLPKAWMMSCRLVGMLPAP
jgi:hypothetical protein